MMQLHQSEHDDMKDVIILDTGSTIPATFMNPELITDIHCSKKPLKMSTNAGTKTIALKGTVPGFGEAWYDNSMMANIYSFAALKDKVLKVTYDSTKEDAFLVHTQNNGVVKFERMHNGLYGFKPGPSFKKTIARTKNPVSMFQTGVKASPQVIANTVYQLQLYVETIKGNMTGFTAKEIKGAKEARSLYYKIGTPTYENFKHLIRSNQIKNCPISYNDAVNAEKIFGPSVASAKGRLPAARLH